MLLLLLLLLLLLWWEDFECVTLLLALSLCSLSSLLGSQFKGLNKELFESDDLDHLL